MRPPDCRCPMLAVGINRKAEPVLNYSFRYLTECIILSNCMQQRRAIQKGYGALEAFNSSVREKSREILGWCACNSKPAILVLARPYHLDPGIGHEIETDLQAHGYPIVWGQYLPLNDDLLDWMFSDEVRNGAIRSPFDIHDVWPSSYSGNTNEILWGAKFAARFPWITCNQADELQMRNGPAYLHAGEGNYRALRHLILLVPGPGLDQARRFHQDSRGNHRLLPGAELVRHHQEQASPRVRIMSSSLNF